MERERMSKFFIKLKCADKRSGDDNKDSDGAAHKKRKSTVAQPANTVPPADLEQVWTVQPIPADEEDSSDELADTMTRGTSEDTDGSNSNSESGEKRPNYLSRINSYLISSEIFIGLIM